MSALRKHHALEPAQHNRLLQRLLRECPSLEPWLVHHDGAAGSELYREAAAISEFCFPTHSLACIVVRPHGGQAAIVQTIGNEGMLGLPAWLGIPRSPDKVVQWTSGTVIRVPVRAFKDALEHNQRAQHVLNGYAVYRLRLSALACLCIAHHSMQQRLCRWLLTSMDRSGFSEVILTQAMLAQMIHARRQSVTEVMAKLQRAGVISQGRNRIQVLDRNKLESFSCGCYQTASASYDRLVLKAA